MAFELPTNEKPLVITPPGGWKEQTYYVVEVSHRFSSPVHRAILFVGFINDKDKPLNGSYTTIMSGTYESNQSARNAWYLKPICEIKELARVP